MNNENPSSLELRIEELEDQQKEYAKQVEDIQKKMRLVTEAFAKMEICAYQMSNHSPAGDEARKRIAAITSELKT